MKTVIKRLTIIFIFILFTACDFDTGSDNDSDDHTDNPPPVTEANDWANENVKAKYRLTALNICDAFSPEYLGLAIEVNTYYQYHEKDFGRFVEFYTDLYNDIKNNSNCSSTKIFVTFQLEKMKGIGTAVKYSGVAQWEILEMFDGKLDLLVFTTYPEVEFSAPADIPENYYSSIYDNVPPNLLNNKLAFTEMGWNSENLISVTGSNNSFQSQADFISRFAVITDTLKNNQKIEFSAWAFMHDFKNTGSYDPFRTIGLQDSTGNAKDVNNTVWNTWTAYKDHVSYRLGIGPIPCNFPGSSSSDWIDMYQQVDTIAELVLAQTEWKDNNGSAGQIPQFFNDLNFAKINNFHNADFIYGINFFNLADGTPLLK